MGQKPTTPDKSDGIPTVNTVLLVFKTIGDTTWRIFVPVLGLCIGGLLLDKQYATEPWIMLAGTLLGTLIAGLLVYQQYKKVMKGDKRA